MSYVLWIRHGATDWNLNGRYLGGTDLPLNNVGRAEFRRLVAAYRQAPIRTIYTSPLLRARESAEVLQRAWACRLVVEERLRELHFGAWEGLTVQEIERQFPRRWRQWLRCTVRGRFPGGGESLQAFHRRINSFLRQHCRRVSQPMTIVAHGGVLRAVLVHVLQLPLPYYWRFHIGRASVSCTRHDGRHVVLEYLNRCFSDEAEAGVNAHA